MEKRFVYMTTNKINEKKYIGKHTCTDLNDSYYGSNADLIEDIKTFGPQNFERIILDWAKDDEELAAKESYHLRLNRVVESPDFYNQSYASSGGDNITGMSAKRYQEYIELQIKVQTGKKRSQKTRERIKKNMVGFKGKSHSEESKKKISQSLKGNILSEETRKNIALNNSLGEVQCYFEGELKYTFESSAEGVRKFIELGLIKSDRTFGRALKIDGQLPKGRLKGWEIVRIDKNRGLRHNCL